MEKERIEKLGGHVFFGNTSVRVLPEFPLIYQVVFLAPWQFPDLSVTHVTNSPRLRRTLSLLSQPIVKLSFFRSTSIFHPADSIRLIFISRFLILACDGLWDVMNMKSASEFVLKNYQVIPHILLCSSLLTLGRKGRALKRSRKCWLQRLYGWEARIMWLFVLFISTGMMRAYDWSNPVFAS